MKAILFDFDGTLVDTQTWYNVAISATLLRFNQKYTVEFCSDYFDGRCWQEIIHEIALQEKFNPDEILHEAILLAHKLILEHIHPNEGVVDVLNILRQSSIKYGICSNSNITEINMGLEKSGLNKYFANENIFGRECVSKGKPAKDIYALGVNKLGVHASECFAVEDSLNGAISSMQAGIKTVIFSGGSHFQNWHKNKFNQHFGFELPFFSNMANALEYIVYAR